MASPPPFSVEDQADEGFVNTFVTDMQPLRPRQQEQQLQHHEQLVYQDYHHHQQLPQSTYDPQAHAHEACYTYHYDYDPSSAAAAAYHHHHYYSHYYPHDYSSATAYLPPSPPALAHPDLASTAAAAAAPSLDPSQHNHDQAIHAYPQPHEQLAGPSSSGCHVAPELNPSAVAAVTAFSQLTQFAGTMEAAERAMARKQERRWHPKGGPQLSMAHRRRQGSPMAVGTSSYKGGSRRGCEPLIGGAVRGNSSYHPSKYDNSVRSFRGRGRGRVGNGGSRRYYQSVPERQLLDSAPAPIMESSSVAEPGIASGQTPLKVTALATETTQMLPWQPLLLLAWCDICRVDCNSFENLEQHKNGKRHKKTVQRIQEIEAQQKVMAELEAKVASKPDICLQKMGEQDGKLNKSSDTPEIVIPAQVNEANQVSTASENLPAKTMLTNHIMESEIQVLVLSGKSESSKEEEDRGEALMFDEQEIMASSIEGQTRGPRMDAYDKYDKRYGQKWKMTRFGHDGKRLRRPAPIRSRPPVHPKEQPRVCTLCNVMCDTLAVFNCHLSGKKHISRINRFQGQHTVYGPISLYIPPNQPSSAYPPQAPEPVFYGLKSHELLQHAVYGLGAVRIEGCGLQQGDQAEQGKTADNAALESRSEQGSEQPEYKCSSSRFEEASSMGTAGAEHSSAFAKSEDLIAVSESGVSLDESPLQPKIDAKVESSPENEDLAA
ncbi:hypothetical protein MUK42_17840 [Musa troglodytarum]|uniref:U1-type domain-containing protein n=1 Tax=Musa troglodytarum TaxID=320322 RepID=A0A9E7G0W9_9LILI|nr:hypothetical protein MUK42_17840 [Musa troglodytarum]